MNNSFLHELKHTPYFYLDWPFSISQVWSTRRRMGLYIANFSKKNRVTVFGPTAIQKRITGKTRKNGSKVILNVIIKYFVVQRLYKEKII